MTFDEILEQVITLLKRQGRVSYPALKIRFSLDDEYLEALKAELLYVHPVRDDDGRGLVWTGEHCKRHRQSPLNLPRRHHRLLPRNSHPLRSNLSLLHLSS